jgi:hypothetical protein
MPRQQAAAGENNFVQGLITETTALKFPPNACTETFNCVFDETGRVTRRLGLDIEDAAVLLSNDFTAGEVFTEFLWESVGGDGDRSFVVQQQGGTLRFYDVSDENNVSGNNTNLTVTLTSYIPSGSTDTPVHYPCQYAQGTGRLVVVNRGMEPIFIEYDADNAVLNVTPIDIKIRDFTGLHDGLGDAERPTATVATLITNNPAHYYNILNQGWYSGDALAQWDTARTDMPSNRDYVALYRTSATDAFDNTRVTANTPGSRLASKGHFTVSAWCPSYTSALAAEGFTATISSSEAIIDMSSAAAFPRIGDFNLVGNGASSLALGELFNGTTIHAGALCAGRAATTAYGGVSPVNARTVTKAVVYGSTDVGFNDGGAGNCTLTLYGKTGSAPASQTDGTSLGTATFTDAADESGGRVLTSSDTTTEWNHIWVRFEIANSGVRCAEIQLYSAPTDPDALFCTTERPQCVEFYAGRAWYTGINFGKLSSNLYFTQIIEKKEQFDLCHQVNDPSAEDFTDLLPDDGGVIKIPEIAEIKRIFAFQTILLVFATNGVWTVSGSNNQGFLSTDFVVRKITSVGTNSPLSVMSIKGSPVWFAEDGIWTVQLDPNNNSFVATSVTDAKIKSFILQLPAFNRQFVKCAYNTNDGVGIWLYNDSEELTTSEYYVYTGALIINGLSGAFYPWTFDSDTVDVRGAVYVNSPAATDTPTIKFTTTTPVDSNTEYLTYSEVYNSNYLDWGLLANKLNDQSYVSDYTSYFITGYRIDGQAYKFFQPRYVYVFHEFGDCVSSCFMQGVFDFTTSGDSGKWSSLQQVFRSNQNHRSVSVARLKVRGKGRSMQLRFVSETGKPFQLIGWAIPETIAGDL